MDKIKTITAGAGTHEITFSTRDYSSLVETLDRSTDFPGRRVMTLTAPTPTLVTDIVIDFLQLSSPTSY